MSVKTNPQRNELITIMIAVIIFLTKARLNIELQWSDLIQIGPLQLVNR